MGYTLIPVGPDGMKPLGTASPALPCVGQTTVGGR